MDKKMMGWGAILLGILIALTVFMGWPNNVNYVWAALAIIWGFLTLKK